MLILLLMALLLTKHFIIDFLWQPEYEWRNKGTLGHLGGIIHSLKHAFGSFIILIGFDNPEYHPTLIVSIVVAEFFIHYITDYGKMNINRIKNWLPNKNAEFWYLVGLDQYIHGMTYIGMTAAMAHWRLGW